MNPIRVTARRTVSKLAVSSRPIPRVGTTASGARTLSSVITKASPTVSRVAMGAGAAAVVASAFASSGLVFASVPTVDYAQLKKEIIEAIEEDVEKRGDGTSIAGTLVRLAWHASGTYSKLDGTGGSNGACMRFSPEKDWGANAGLDIARDFLEPLKAKYTGVSYADLWTLAGSAAIEQMGGPTISWSPGRSDTDKPTTVPDGRLPDADKGQLSKTQAHIREIFGRMGFSDREMVALLGAHAVGRCHTEASGYWGPWTFAETSFSNEYFRLLLEEKWTIKTTHNGKPWTGPDQFEDPTGALMMLPSDMALIWDKDFRTTVELYAKDEDVFLSDFAAAFAKLISLGVPKASTGGGMLSLSGVIGKLKSLVGM
ncbi:unnamed protein product [Discosporangium mesarthrocarpum]